MPNMTHRIAGTTGALALMVSLQAAPASTQEVTWARDVAPIVYEACAECHNPTGSGPMSLLDYQTARRYSSRIRSMVAAREMPPWHIDRDVGIQEFKNDASLSDEEIQTFVRWVDGGALEGDPSQAPPAPAIPSGDQWRLEAQFGPPDLVIRSTPFDVPEVGLDSWWTPEVVVEGIDGPRWIMANETKPAYPMGRKVVHHANTNLVPASGGRGSGFTNFGVGKPYDIYPDNTGQLVNPGDKVSFNIHYYPVGEAVQDDVVEVGLWFYPEGVTPRFETEGDVQWSSQREILIDETSTTLQQLVIPPHGYAVTQGIQRLEEPTRIHSCRGHMHLRGSSQQLEAVFPDGHTEVLCKVNWNGLWHITYLFEDDVQPLLPAGTVLLLTAWYDNTANNPVNPDPDQWVTYGRRSGDEMSHMWIGVTYLSDEDFEFLQTQRERRVAQQQQ
jgi:hypothetical protein